MVWWLKANGSDFVQLETAGNDLFPKAGLVLKLTSPNEEEITTSIEYTGLKLYHHCMAALAGLSWCKSYEVRSAVCKVTIPYDTVLIH